jgi:hypothetical protein
MQLPMPFRAALGLAAEAVENARHLPDRAIELPMLAVSTALQMSLRAQQRYAMLAARGEEVLNRREPGDEPPPWATFDEDEMRGTGGDPLLGEVAEDLPDLGGKPINGPRNGAPSRFDAIGDE